MDFGLKEIDELSRRVPCICKVAPNGSYHVEDVHRAGGIYTILGELDRAGLLNRDVHTVHGAPISAWDLRSESVLPEAVELYHAAPGGVRTTKGYSQSASWETLDLDAAVGCIRDVAHAYTADGGLCMLYGNIAPGGRGGEDRRACPRSCGRSPGLPGCSSRRRTPSRASSAAAWPPVTSW